ncbi:MAG: hypothetical protein JST19_03675 [Bacteroidetes bacterium]|nr:hypothetical protein [Bacteroidota bacterium]
MTQENFEYLKKQVKYTGFGDALEFALKDNMEKGAANFQLQHSAEFGKDKVNALLNFRLSEQGMYFFNSYDMTVQKEGVPDMKQTFSVYGPQSVEKKGEAIDGEPKKEWVNSNITFKEGYNLMQDRAVFKDFVSKEGEKYSSWVILNAKDTDEHGNCKIKRLKDFDLKAKLAEYPIKELDNADSKKQLIESLEKGNRPTVTMLFNGKEEKRAIEANPVYRGIKMFDGNQRTIMQQQDPNAPKEGNAQTMAQNTQADTQNTIKNDQAGPQHESSNQNAPQGEQKNNQSATQAESPNDRQGLQNGQQNAAKDTQGQAQNAQKEEKKNANNNRQRRRNGVS